MFQCFPPCVSLFSSRTLAITGPRADPAKLHAILARDHYAALLCGDTELLSNDPLDVLARRFGPGQFLRVHRSAIINMARRHCPGPAGVPQGARSVGPAARRRQLSLFQIVRLLRRVVLVERRQRLALPRGDQHVQVVLPTRPKVASELAVAQVVHEA